MGKRVEAHEPYYYWRRMVAEFQNAKGCNVGYSENELSLAYHETVVARYYFDDGKLILCNGGWLTYYTKERINRFCNVLGLPVGVHQCKKRWYVLSPLGEEEWGHIDDGDPGELEVPSVFPERREPE